MFHPIEGARWRIKLLAKFVLGPYREEWVNVAKDPRNFLPAWGPRTFCLLQNKIFLIGTDLRPPSLLFVYLTKGTVRSKRVNFPSIDCIDVLGDKVALAGKGVLAVCQWNGAKLIEIARTKVFDSFGPSITRVKWINNNQLSVVQFIRTITIESNIARVKVLRLNKGQIKETEKWEISWKFAFPGFLEKNRLVTVEGGKLCIVNLTHPLRIEKIRLKSNQFRNLFGEIIGKIGSHYLCDSMSCRLILISSQGKIINWWKYPWYRYAQIWGQRFFVSSNGKIYMIGELHGKTPYDRKWYRKGNLWWCEWGIFELVPPKK